MERRPSLESIGAAGTSPFSRAVSARSASGARGAPMGRKCVRGLVSRVSGLACLMLLLLAAPAGATVLVVDGVERARPWQDWVDRAKVPGPRGTITVHLAGCPGHEQARGCTLSDRPAVFVRPDLLDAPATLLHELGHVFDRQHMTDALRARFAATIGSHLPWAGQTGLREAFAEAYGLCARRSEISYPDGTLPRDWDYTLYLPTERQHRRACDLIRGVETGR